MRKINSAFYIPSSLSILVTLCCFVVEINDLEYPPVLLIAVSLMYLLSVYPLLWILKNVVGIKKLYNAIRFYAVGVLLLFVRSICSQIIMSNVWDHFVFFILAAHFIQYPLMYFVYVVFRHKEFTLKKELRILGIVYLLELWLTIFLSTEFNELVALWTLLAIFPSLALIYLIRQASMTQSPEGA
jgi:hypothetical protein